jgi:GTP-binding protein
MDVEFLGSFTAQSLPPAVYPEIAIGGRSNVGKSSFVNTLLGRRSMARVSSKPGKTRTINFYLYSEKVVLADLPGYGYSKAPQDEQRRWARDVELYLTNRKTLRGVVLVGDQKEVWSWIERVVKV